MGGGFGAPPPPKRGPSVVTIILAVVGLLFILGIGSCATCVCLARSASHHSTSTSSGGAAGKPRAPVSPPPPVTPTPPPPHQSGWITAERPYVKFLPPSGWKHDISSDRNWGVFTSPTGDAVLAFTTFNQPSESTSRLSQAAGVLGVSGVEWRSPRNGPIGRDHFPAHVGDGSCNFKGPKGYIWYATVDAGGSNQILLIFTVTANAPANLRKEAQSAVDSLQRR